MEIEHQLYAANERGGWIVKSSIGDRSLQTFHYEKPTKQQLDNDYALLDEKLRLAQAIANAGGVDSFIEKDCKCLCHRKEKLRKSKRGT